MSSVDLNSVLNTYSTTAAVSIQTSAASEDEDEKSILEQTLEASQETSSKKDSYISSMSDEDRASMVEQMKDELEAMKLRFVNTVKDSILGQSKAQSKASGSIWDKFNPYQTQEEAQASISDDGYWGVEQTAQRLVKFAQSLAGGDASLAEEMRQAVIKGFGQAEDTWGSELPEISQKTYNRTMELFDEWAGVKSDEE